MPPDDQLFTLASAIKVQIATYYATQGWALPGQGGEDGVQQVVPGQPAYDCPMLAVQVLSVDMHAGDPNVSQPQIWPGTGFQQRAARVAVYVLRCVPVMADDGGRPPVADVEAASALVLADPTRVYSALLDAVDTGALPIRTHKAVSQQGWQALEPSGGMGGGVLTVLVDLTDWV